MTIKTILIDDERKALEILSNKIERFCPELKILNSFQEPNKAIKAIEREEPDLIFLDISMPGLSGFELLERIENKNLEVIFATAFDEFALKALQQCALGYLVKPVDNQELIRAVNNALVHIKNKQLNTRNQVFLENLKSNQSQKEKLAIPLQSGLEFVFLEEIVHFQGDKGYTKIVFAKNKAILSSHSIGYYSKILQQRNFFLVHKSHLINMQHIKKYYNEGYVELSNGDKIPISRAKRQEFLKTI